jgi:hypothetical protein
MLHNQAATDRLNVAQEGLAMLRVSVSNERQQIRIDHSRGPLELGRGAGEGEARVVIDDPYVSRDQLRIQLCDDNQLLVENRGAPARFSDGKVLNQGDSRTLALPVQVNVGQTLIEVELQGPLR